MMVLDSKSATPNAPSAASKRKPTATLKKVALKKAPEKKVTAKTPAKTAVTTMAQPAAKTMTTSVAKPVLKPLAKAGATASSKILTPAKPKVDKQLKTKKPKLVRDSFTIPKAEYTVMDDLKQRAAKLTFPIKKSELLRAGIKALAAMPDQAFLAALTSVPAIKTGRPSKV